MSMAFYHGLLADSHRIEAFRSLIHTAVSPGDVVVEVGSGLGTYSFFAAEAGARAVYGIESDPIVHVATHLARTNELEDRVQFIRGSAPDVSLPEPADVLIFEDFPARLLDQDTVRLLRDSAGRYLKPGGRLLPARARLLLAPVSSHEVWQELFPFGAGAFHAHGLDMGATTGYVGNAPTMMHLHEGSLAADPVVLGEVPLHPCPTPDRLGGHASWPANDVPVHGLAYWFELETGPGTWMASSGRHPRTPGGGVWGQMFLPFEVPLPPSTSGTLDVGLEVHAFPDGTPGWLRWSGTVGTHHRTAHEFAAEPAGMPDLFRKQKNVDAGAAVVRDADVFRRRADESGDLEPGPDLGAGSDAGPGPDTGSGGPSQ